MISVPLRPTYILVYEPISSGPLHAGHILVVHGGTPVMGASLYRNNEIGVLVSEPIDVGPLRYIPPGVEDLLAKKITELRRRLERKR